MSLVHENSSEEESVPQSQVIKGPLNKRFYLAMLQLESQLSQKIMYSMQSVLDLVEMYGKCVEYFDTKLESVKWYFMEKIQTTLAESKTHQLILEKEKEVQEQNRKAKETKPMIKVTNVTIDPLLRSNGSGQKNVQMPLPTNMVHHNPKTNSFDINAPLDQKKISYRQLKEIRSKKLTLIEKVQRGKDELQGEQIIQRWDQDVNETDQLIKTQLQEQVLSIQNRLLNRRKQTKKLTKQNVSMGFLCEKDEDEESNEFE